MKISKEVKTAILVLLGIALFIFGYNYLKGKNLFESDSLYYTEFDYNALSKSSVVTVKGNTVGKVQDIIYDYKTGKTKVAFSVNEQLKFSKNSIVKMYQTGLMSGNALAIQISEEGELAKPGDVLKSKVEVGIITSLSKNFTGVSSDLNTTLKTTDTLLGNINKIVVDESDEGLKKTIAELNATLKSFKELSLSANSLIAQNDQNIAAIIDNFKNTSQNLSQLSEQLKEANLDDTLKNLNTAVASLNNMLSTIDNGEGSIGKLLKDEGLYNNLEGATLQLEQLLQDMKLNPKRYVHFSLFGKKAKQYDAEGNEIKDKE
ncbi:organic solvent ABC transporter substrate-binding protein [Yeosuana aromativorans]|uniref:Organic solvent ABC transporter substrate-binding protein n=1 Tax=Yeosuana aromativorans TaxID=288019 RepID=A0A8J3FHA4_9FLAO|nr:MlaD family protein [Yeosuana aromativorans]GGK28153.1 organic solvent ABC transporter substrate-binding protein [Yeosuana aromativorans]